jgi:hypothetical protein
MLNGAGLKDDLRSGVWAECAMTVTFLSNITSVKNQEVCPHQLLFGCKPKLPASLRSFGEIGVVTTKDNIQGKLKNRVLLVCLLAILHIMLMMSIERLILKPK